MTELYLADLNSESNVYQYMAEQSNWCALMDSETELANDE